MAPEGDRGLCENNKGSWRCIRPSSAEEADELGRLQQSIFSIDLFLINCVNVYNVCFRRIRRLSCASTSNVKLACFVVSVIHQLVDMLLKDFIQSHDTQSRILAQSLTRNVGQCPT